MKLIAIAVVVAYLVVTVQALRGRPGGLAAQDFLHVWRFSPWGKQFIVDFYGMEVVLGVFVVSHALANGTLTLALVCLALMPALGALPPAVYLLVAG